MIVTLTANPSIDRTVTLDTPLTRGSVHRATEAVSDPGGKGVNVARVLTTSGRDAVAVLPGNQGDPLLSMLDNVGVRFDAVATAGPARVNLTVSENDGTTTKINEPGIAVTAETMAELHRVLLNNAQQADWVVLSGSLPPGIPSSWYADLVEDLRRHSRCKIAVDTSDEPLLALAERFPESAPDLIKPNAEELAQLTGSDADALEQAAAAGDPTAAVAASHILLRRGVGAVLATLGSAGAVLVTADGAWSASPARIAARSTVGAGDSSLAGYVLAELDGDSPADRLRRAVSYGTAAAALPGTELPTPQQTNPRSVTVRALDSPPDQPPISAETKISVSPAHSTLS